MACRGNKLGGLLFREAHRNLPLWRPHPASFSQGSAQLDYSTTAPQLVKTPRSVRQEIVTVTFGCSISLISGRTQAFRQWEVWRWLRAFSRGHDCGRVPRKDAHYGAIVTTNLRHEQDPSKRPTRADLHPDGLPRPHRPALADQSRCGAQMGRGKGSWLWLALQLLAQAKPPALIRALKQAANAERLL